MIMLKRMGTFLLSTVILVGSIYVAIVLGLFIFQRKIIYVPDSNLANPAHHGLSHLTMLPIPTPDGETLNSWFIPASDSMPMILYFHGNAQHLAMRADKIRTLVARGYGILAVSYRGYGGSTGSPSEQGLYTDAKAALALLESQGYQASDLIYYGESLGTGVAIELASHHAPKMLVLEAPYQSVAVRGQEIYWYIPVTYLIRDRFDSINKIGKLTIPILLFHGEKDETMPVHHGRAVADAITAPKRVIFYPDVAHTDFDPALLADEITEFYHHITTSNE